MANTTGVSIQFKTDLLTGTHSLTNSANVINAALYLVTATINSMTADYTATGEVSGAGYSARGVAVTHAVAPTNNGANSVGYWTPSASIAFGTVTLSTAFDTVLLYFNTDDNAIACWNFGSTTVNGGTFTITMPANAYNTALLQLG